MADTMNFGPEWYVVLVCASNSLTVWRSN